MVVVFNTGQQFCSGNRAGFEGPWPTAWWERLLWKAATLYTGCSPKGGEQKMGSKFGLIVGGVCLKQVAMCPQGIQWGHVNVCHQGNAQEKVVVKWR